MKSVTALSLACVVAVGVSAVHATESHWGRFADNIRSSARESSLPNFIGAKCTEDSYCNLAIGLHAGWNLTLGKRNIFVGDNACPEVTTGSDNICIGNNTHVPTPETNNFINIANVQCIDLTLDKEVSCP